MSAARPGIEPRYRDSESRVLPLDDLAILRQAQDKFAHVLSKRAVILYISDVFGNEERFSSGFNRNCSIMKQVLWQLQQQRQRSGVRLKLISVTLIMRSKNQRPFAQSLKLLRSRFSKP